MSQRLPKIIKQYYRDKTGQMSRHLFRFIMITLLAESKTMSSDQTDIDLVTFKEHEPALEESADMIMHNMEGLTPAEISSILGISNALAIKAHSLAYDFAHKQTGYKALYGFIGEAYRAFDAKSLSADAIKRSDDTLRIISSVYGILKPSDLLKPYRCEFKKEIGPNHKSPVQILKPKVTIHLVDYVKKNKVKDIINLLPGDADKCIDWKILRAFVSMHKITFLTIDTNGKLKTPMTKKLKEIRGEMARIILEQNIQSFQELTKVKSENFIYSPEDSKTGLPVFITT